MNIPASNILFQLNFNTKDEEQEILSGFLARLEYKPDNLKSTEKPDFEFQYKNNLIGVEVTKYYPDFSKNGSNSHQRIVEWKKVAEKLKLKLSKINPKFEYLYASIHFKKVKFKYNQLLNDELFGEILKLINLYDIDNLNEKSISIDCKQSPNLYKIIDSIHFYIVDSNKYLWWDSSLQSGKVIQNNNILNEIIEKKNKLSENYKIDFFQKWLLIYAAGIGLHDMFNFENKEILRQGKITWTDIEEQIDNNKIPNVNSTYFTHIFIWDKFTERIYLLYPNNKKIFDAGELKIWVNHLPLEW